MANLVKVEKQYGWKDILNGYQMFQAAIAAVELSLFDILEEHGGCKKEEIIEITQMDGQFASAFLQTLMDMDLLSIHDDYYKNTEIASNYFVRKHPQYVGNLFAHIGKEDKKWVNLDLVLKSKLVNTPPLYETAASIQAQSQYIKLEQKQIIKKLKEWSGFSGKCKVLDISSPQGLYAVELCRLYPNLDATILINKENEPAVEKLLDYYQLSERVDIFTDELVTVGLEEFDIVIVSHILYEQRKQLVPILTEVSKHIKPGGLLISNHWFCSPACGSKDEGINDLNKSVFIAGHPLCNEEKFRTFIDQSGFTVILSEVIASFFGDCHLNMAIKMEDKQTESPVSPKQTKCCG